MQLQGEAAGAARCGGGGVSLAGRQVQPPPHRRRCGRAPVERGRGARVAAPDKHRALAAGPAQRGRGQLLRRRVRRRVQRRRQGRVHDRRRVAVAPPRLQLRRRGLPRLWRLGLLPRLCLWRRLRRRTEPASPAQVKRRPAARHGSASICPGRRLAPRPGLGGAPRAAPGGAQRRSWARAARTRAAGLASTARAGARLAGPPPRLRAPGSP
jgi:hypothetical protein